MERGKDWGLKGFEMLKVQIKKEKEMEMILLISHRDDVTAAQRAKA